MQAQRLASVVPRAVAQGEAPQTVVRTLPRLQSLREASLRRLCAH